MSNHSWVAFVHTLASSSLCLPLLCTSQLTQILMAPGNSRESTCGRAHGLHGSTSARQASACLTWPLLVVPSRHFVRLSAVGFNHVHCCLDAIGLSFSRSCHHDSVRELRETFWMIC